ncbi:ribonuclease HIII [Chlamydiales bacterium]|nr:ribonuclease HIII [Chlamydiales bacterium]
MAPFVTKIDVSHSEKLIHDLREQGFTFSEPPYTHFSAKKKGVSCTFYQSGKLTVQGKEMDAFIEFYLEPEILKTFEYSHKEFYLDKKPRTGIDEAGKGDFFGPLCIAGVYTDAKGIDILFSNGVKDSKKMNDVLIGKLAKIIKKECLHHIVQINPEKYNEIYPKFNNLNRLLAWGHATCIEQLVKKSQCKDVIIDQFANESVVIEALERKQLNLNLVQRHKGEEDIVVAAASILARDAFVRGLANLSKMINSELPKGASNKVVQMAKHLYSTQGEKGLNFVSKRHFKTWKEVTGIV